MAPVTSRLPAHIRRNHETAWIEDLTESELEALLGAATWYVKYHEPGLPELAGDGSAWAESHRRHFVELHKALKKLGVRLRPPPGVELRA